MGTRLYKIRVDLDASREEAEYLETIKIEADDEDEALEKADKIVEEGMFGGPYYNVKECDKDGEIIWDDPEYDDDGNPRITEEEQERANHIAKSQDKGEM